MDFQAVKGTRDFYPDAMRLRNWIGDAWRRVSLRNGFEEYDAPIFEYLDLFTIKSGQEIAEQLFNFVDRGGRNLAIRPEITPSLARMVNAKINALPRPIKWFSIPRLCRAENPQKGRLREFFQWNIDVIGEKSVLADAECIYVCVDFLREVGLGPQDVQVRIGSRPATMAAIKSLGLADEADKLLPILDKRPKVSPEAFQKLTQAAGLNDEQVAALGRFQDAETIEDIRRQLGDSAEVASDLQQIETLFENLTAMGVGDYCKLDLRIVRGLAYYTGIVYEVFDAGQSLRAVAGGGRYDNLLGVLGGPDIPATGFGMGDVVLSLLLADKKKLPNLAAGLDFFVIDGEDGSLETCMQVVGALREKGFWADFSYTRRSLSKQLKEANKRQAGKAVIVRGADRVSIKDLATGRQEDMSLSEFLTQGD